MRKYIIVYAYKDKDGTTGYGNTDVSFDMKQMTVAGFGAIVEDIKQTNGYKEICVLNMIALGEEEE